MPETSSVDGPHPSWIFEETGEPFTGFGPEALKDWLPLSSSVAPVAGYEFVLDFIQRTLAPLDPDHLGDAFTELRWGLGLLRDRGWISSDWAVSPQRNAETAKYDRLSVRATVLGFFNASFTTIEGEVRVRSPSPVHCEACGLLLAAGSASSCLRCKAPSCPACMSGSICIPCVQAAEETAAHPGEYCPPCGRG